MDILITGATGLIGSKLGMRLVQDGHVLTALTRRGRADDLPFPCRAVAWDHKSILNPEILDPQRTGFDVVIHLAGEPVAQRWTSAAKKRIYASRVQSTKALVASVAKLTVDKLTKTPEVWLNASAIGYYGDTEIADNAGAKTTEQSPPGRGFLCDVVKDWEGALNDSLHENKIETRSVFLRFGVILSAEGGALPSMILPFRYGLGGTVGHGRQLMSWIHEDDAIEAIRHILAAPSIHGPVNIVAPRPCTNQEFSMVMQSIWPSVVRIPTPPWGLRMILGDMSQMITQSSGVKSNVLSSSGFSYQWKDLKDALVDLVASPLAAQMGRGARLFVARQWVPGAPETHFPFFSAAENLERITPPWLHFKILRKSTAAIESGTLIDYKLRIKGFPVRWRTRIESFTPPERFVDTQLRGPYKIWHHSHFFKPLAGGTLMEDRVFYKNKVWPFGDIALPMIQHDIRTIFGYRKKFIASHLNHSKS